MNLSSFYNRKLEFKNSVCMDVNRVENDVVEEDFLKIASFLAFQKMSALRLKKIVLSSVFWVRKRCHTYNGH